MTDGARTLHIAFDSPARKRLPLQTGLSMALFAMLHLCFESLLALPGWLPPLLLGEALILAMLLPRKYSQRQGVTMGAMAALALVALCLLPEAQDGVKHMMNRLFSLSEARNRYVYTRFSVSTEAQHSETLFRMGLAIPGAFLSIIIANSKSKAGVLILTALLVGAEIYFGIVPDTAIHLLSFLCLAAVLISKGTAVSLAHYTWLLIAALVMVLLVGLFFPGIDPALERRSEQVRDWFSQTLKSGATGGADANDSMTLTRKEGLLAEDIVNGVPDEVQDARAYERRFVYQQDISNPQPLNYMRIALLFVLIIALLLVPFLPFLWLDRQKRKAAAMRADFDSPDCKQAILAMFRCIVHCLTVLGISDNNMGFLHLLQEDDARISDAYRGSYQCAALVWQEAAYSDHPMTTDQKETVLGLLKETERIVCERTDRRTRFRLKYIDCLILTNGEVR